MKRFRITWKSLVLTLIGIAGFILYLVLVNVDFGQLSRVLGSVNLFWYLSAFGLSVLATLCFAVSWQVLLNFLSVKLSVMRSFVLVWVGIYVDILIPAESISGEITKCYLVSREHVGSSGKVIASLFLQRVLGTLVNVASLALGVVMLLMEGSATSVVMWWSVLLLGVLSSTVIVMVVVGFNARWLERVVVAIVSGVQFITRGRWNLVALRDQVLEMSRMFHESVQGFRRAKGVVFISLLGHLCSWILHILGVYLVFIAIEFPVRWSVVVIVFSLMMAIKGIPLGVPFEAGLPEVSMTFLYSKVFGIPDVVSVTATLLDRFLNVWLKFLIGFGLQQYLGLSLSQIGSSENESDDVDVEP